MPFPDELKLEDLDEIAILSESDPKRISIRLGLICTLYVQNPHDASVRLALARCGDDYLALFGEHLKLYIRPDGIGKHKPYPNQGFSLVEYILENDTPDKGFSPEFTGGSNYSDACSHSLDISAVGTELFPAGDRPAFFSATLPFSYVFNQPGQAAFQNLVHKWCKILKPYSGYGGLGVIQSVDSTEKLRTVRQVYPLARRFPGLEVDNPNIIANHIGSNIKGVNWLTILSDLCLLRIGGRRAMLANLDENYKIFDYEAGVIIQAGLTPQLGDVNRKQIPKYYRELARILKPLRMEFPEGHSFIRPNGRSGAEATNEWLARFDE